MRRTHQSDTLRPTGANAFRNSHLIQSCSGALARLAEISDSLQRALDRNRAVAGSPHVGVLIERLEDPATATGDGHPAAVLDAWRAIQVRGDDDGSDPVRVILERVLSAEHATDLLRRAPLASELVTASWGSVHEAYADARADEALIEYVDVLWRHAAATARAALSDEGTAEHDDAIEELDAIGEDLKHVASLLRERPWTEA